MTNYEMIKKFSKENMALTIMCPYEAGLMDSYRCDEKGNGVADGNCRKCILSWLGEDSTYSVGDRVIFLLFHRETIGVITKIIGNNAYIDAGAGELEIPLVDICEIIL